MKGDKQVLRHLNKILKNELTAINQYFLHSRLLEDWGADRMAKHEYKESIEEMEHADALIKRIIMLGGIPNLQELGKLHIGETVPEVIAGDLKLEELAIPDLKEAIGACEAAHDFVTRDLLVDILSSEEGHLDHLETQQHMIETQGLKNYLQLQSKPQDAQE
ncbi:MAG: bacterioferritin [Rhodospirillales bacterium]|nr:bacterioferritin [Rhodospirillales bacterium]MCB9995143.1 bacterioferritin [Rhodospirillales bacterium]